MGKLEKFKSGDLCLHNGIPVLVLNYMYQYSSFIQEEKYNCRCLILNKIKLLSESSLRKI